MAREASHRLASARLRHLRSRSITRNFTIGAVLALWAWFTSFKLIDLARISRLDPFCDLAHSLGARERVTDGVGWAISLTGSRSCVVVLIS